MYALASKLLNLPVMSLQTGETIALLHRPIVDPATLELVAYRCKAPTHGQELVLMTRDIRQMALDCLIIDSEDELTEIEDIVRIKALLDQGFTPLQKRVITDLGRHIGHVEDYTVNLETNRIQKLYVRQPLLRAFFNASTIIDRTQIIDVTPRQITIRDTITKVPVLPTDPVPDGNT